MSNAGIILNADEADGVSLRGTRVLFLAGADSTEGASALEMRTIPGFDTGAHRHSRIEEYFYVLSGEVQAQVGERTVVGGPGTFVFVPKGAPHSIANRSTDTAAFLLFTAPPGHERYFRDLADVLAVEGLPDAELIAQVRARHDTEQLSALRTN